MKATALDREIRARIDAHLADIARLVKSAAIGAVHGVLGGSLEPVSAVVAAPRRGPGRPRKAASATAAPKAGRAGKRAKRSSVDVQATADTFLAYVKANPGQSVEEIGQALGVPTKELQLPVVKLVQARAVRTEGQRRGTKYFAGGGRAKRSRRAKKA